MKKYIVVLLVSAGLVLLTASPQQLNAQRPYIRCNAYSFQAGDTVWFSGYITGLQNPSEYNSNLSVDLFNDFGQLIEHEISPVIQSLSAGQVILPGTLPSGNYWLRVFAGNQFSTDSSRYFFLPLAVYTPTNIPPVAYKCNLAGYVGKPVSVDFAIDTISANKGAYNSWSVHIKDSVRYIVSVSVTDADKTNSPPVNILDNNFSNSELSCNHYTDSTFLLWKGKAKTNNGKLLKKQDIVVIINKDSLIKTLVVQTDSIGQFELKHVFFYDSAKIFFQLNHFRDTSATHIQLSFEPSFNPSFHRPIYWSKKDTINANYIPDTSLHNIAKDEHELKPVTVEAKKSVRNEMDDKYTTGIFSEPTLYAFDVRNQDPTWDIGELLRKYVPQVDYFMPTQAPTYKGLPIVIFYVDEQFRTWDELLGYRFTDFAYVKVFTGTWFGFTPFLKWETKFQDFDLKPSSNGLATPESIDPLVVSIYTKKGSDISTTQGMPSFILTGYSPVHRWYGTAQNKETLYWTPLQEGNDFTIPFKNNGVTKRYRLVIEGMNTTGHLLHFEKVIE